MINGAVDPSRPPRQHRDDGAGCDVGGAGGGYPQHQACRGDHAGEPELRFVLRDLSGRGWDRDDQRGTAGVFAELVVGDVSEPVSRRARHQQRRGARRRGRDRGRARRTDGRLRHPDREGARLVRRSQRAGVSVGRGTRRHGLPRRHRGPELLAVRPGLRVAGPPVRDRSELEPSRARVAGLGVVRRVHQPGRSAVVHLVARRGGPAPGLRAEPAGPDADLSPGPT